jgi:hypothetical protein
LISFALHASLAVMNEGRVGHCLAASILAALALDLSLGACAGKGNGGAPGGASGSDTLPNACGQKSNGSRLELEQLVGDDGSKQISSDWYDSQTASYCRFGLATDATLRCLPTDASAVSFGGYLYRDASCSQPIVLDDRVPCAQSWLGNVKYVREPLYPPDACSDIATRLFSVRPASGITTIYRSTGPDSCTEVPRTVDPELYARLYAQPVYDVGPEVAPATFVAGTRATAGARLRYTYVRGDDGSNDIPTTAVVEDMNLGIACQAQTDADGAMRYLPADTFGIQANSFSDSACTSRGVRDVRPDCLRSAAGLVYGATVDLPPSCLTDSMGNPVQLNYPRQRIFRLGAKQTLSTIYGRDGTTCSVDIDPRSFDFYPLGAEVSPTTFVGAAKKTIDCGPEETSGTRLKARSLVADDGYADVSDIWLDTALGTECSFVTANDGALRCIPWSLSLHVTGEYSDAACTKPIVRERLPCFSYPDGPRYAIAEGPARAALVCSPLSFENGITVYQVGAPSTPATVYGGDPANCLAAPNDPPIPYYELGAEVPASSFVAGTWQRAK